MLPGRGLAYLLEHYCGFKVGKLVSWLIMFLHGGFSLMKDYSGSKVG